MKMNTEMRHSVSYYKWKNMVQRCYDKKIHKKYKPEYKDKSVCEEWLNYSNFRIWFDEHYVPYKNNQIDLDKDLLVQGIRFIVLKRVYSYCIIRIRCSSVVRKIRFMKKKMVHLLLVEVKENIRNIERSRRHCL